MSINRSKATRTATCVLFFLISFFVVQFASPKKGSSSTDYASILHIAAAFLLLAILIILAVRTTIVTWITLLVLLAFAGNRRRVLVKNGRRITLDVAMHLAMVVAKERGIAVFACVAFASLIAMAWLRKLV